MNKKVSIIIAGQPATGEFPDRKGGELNSGLIKKLVGFEEKIDVDKIKTNLDDCLSGIGDVLSDLRQKAMAGWELESVTVSLAVSAEGSIGIATAGVEASIEVSFAPKK
jgi:hypothetical protein